ncbi:MAG: prepilin-type N-terminal cleavage/methylation domain-containing protein [Candidatus Saccharimonadales bacterium]
MRSLRTVRKESKGFTLVELMIATAVFGMVLLVIATAIINLSRLYYKGLTETKVQAATRTILDTVSQSIQFNGGAVTATAASPTPGNSYAFCVGNTQYSYTVGYQLADAPTSGQTYHGVVAQDVAGCTSSTPAQNVRVSSVVGREMLFPNMRLTKLEVLPVGAYYVINIRVVYGDDDLLYSPSNPSDTSGFLRADASCKNIRSGSQFCSVSDTTSVVTKRVE